MLESVLPRAAGARFQDLVRIFPVVVVTGARQTGKTTMVLSHQAMRERQRFTLDYAETRAAAIEDPAGFLARAPEMVIDEVQRAPGLMLAIKAEVDRELQSRPGRFVLTGSANLLMMKQVSDSLAGRAAYLRLGPLTRREQTGTGETGRWDVFFRDDVRHWRDALLAEPPIAEPWTDAVSRGGLPPPALRIPPEGRAEWFASYISSYVERDLRDLMVIELLPDFQRVMKALALRIGNPVNQTDIARELGVQQRNISRWINLLEISWLLVPVPTFRLNRASRLAKRSKVYWNDSALAMHVASETAPRGAHMENLVLADLQAWRELHAPRPEILYWRTTDNAEVDFVVEKQNRVLAVEVKTTANPGRGDWQHLARFMAEYRHEAVGAVLLYDGDEIMTVGDRILAVPWWRVI